jgi:hypothetical protein
MLLLLFAVVAFYVLRKVKPAAKEITGAEYLADLNTQAAARRQSEAAYVASGKAFEGGD